MEHRSDDSRNHSVVPRIVLGIAILVAIVVRVLFLEDKPFWRDEAWGALLVDNPGGAIEGGRPVPYGFLWLVRLVREIVPGPPEITYRIVPLLAGIAFVPLVARAATLFGAARWVAVSSACAAAGIVPLVYYSRELKPYGIDALLALVVPMLAIAVFSFDRPGLVSGRPGMASDRDGRAAKAALLFTVVLAPWVTFAGIFPIGAVLIWGWLVWARDAGASGRRDLAILSASFVASFAASYFVAIAPQVTSPRLLIYWESRMLGSIDGSFASRLATGVTDYVWLSSVYFFGKALWKPILVIAAVGAVAWPRPHRYFLLWMYIGSAALCLAAAMTDRYLIAHGRHLMFALPPLLLWAPYGIWTLARPLGPQLRVLVTAGLPAAFALYFVFVSIERRVGPYRTNITEFFHYDTLQNMDDAITGAEPLVAPGDPVIISLRSGTPFQFYRRGRLPQATYCEISCPEWEQIAAEWLAPIEGRAWLFLTDEEIKRATTFIPENGFAFTERVSVRGARVWQLDRVPAGDKPG